MVGVTGLAPAASWLQIRPSPNWQYTPIKLAGDKGIEPLQEDSKSSALPLCKSPVIKVERVEGIEPSHRPWQGCRLPLHHTRVKIGGPCQSRTGDCWMQINRVTTSTKSPKKWRKVRVLPPQWLLHHGSLANCYDYLTIRLPSIKLAEAVGIEPTRVYGPRRFQDAFLDLPDYFRKINWWTRWESNSHQIDCKSVSLSLRTCQPIIKNLVGVVGFEPTEDMIF